MAAAALDKIPLTILDKKLNLLRIGYEGIGVLIAGAITLQNVKKDATNA
jgi:hypothetical protein